MANAGPSLPARLVIPTRAGIERIDLPVAPSGESPHEVFLNGITQPTEVEFLLLTDLASHVLRQHDEFRDSVIAFAEATADFPEEAPFRVVVEQAWSIDHFLRHAPPERAERMTGLPRSGHVELTALFGNMVTELCGPKSLARALYHAYRISRRYGIPLVTAEHNDIPGMRWGLAQILTEAGSGSSPRR